MSDPFTGTIEEIFRYFDNTPPDVTSGERFLIEEQRMHAAKVGRARARWLAEHHAEQLFPCGFVRWEASTGEGSVIVELFVTAAVTDDSVEFLVERPDRSAGGPIEVGSVDRASISEVTVCTLDGLELPHPAAEPIDPEPEVVLVIRWRDGSGATAEQRLLFASAWEAWRAGDRLRAAMTSADRLSM
jgi:hypothetical protein